MLAGGGLLGFLSLLLLAYCLLELVTTPGSEVRGLPKPLWFPVLLVPLVGGLLWFLVGRPRPGAARRAPRPKPAGAPDDDEAFLRELRRRAEEQRRRAEQQRREQQRRDEGERPA